MDSNDDINDYCDLCLKNEWKTSCDNCDKFTCFNCIKRCKCDNDICDQCGICSKCNYRNECLHPFLDKKIFVDAKYKTLRIYPIHNDIVTYKKESNDKMETIEDYIHNECKTMMTIMKNMGCDEDKINNVIEAMKDAYYSANFLN